MKQLLITLVFILSALALNGAAKAVQQQLPFKSVVVAIGAEEPLSAERQQCSNTKETMSACHSFIKGFLQGALLTDTAIIESLKIAKPTFTERALRTRAGKRTDSPTALAGFCLPADRTIFEIAEETLDHVKESERNSADLAKNVYASLKFDYPCK